MRSTLNRHRLVRMAAATASLAVLAACGHGTGPSAGAGATSAPPTSGPAPPSSSPTDIVVAATYSRHYGGFVLVISPSSGVDPSVTAWLGHSSGTIDTVAAVDSNGAVPPAAVQKLGTAVSGMGGFTSASLPAAG